MSRSLNVLDATRAQAGRALSVTSLRTAHGGPPPRPTMLGPVSSPAARTPLTTVTGTPG